MPADTARLRRHAARLLAVVLVVATFLLTQLPGVSRSERARLAARFHFTALPIAEPAGLPVQRIRNVNPRYQRIQAWISSVGAGVAMADLDGDGRANDLCYVDPRIDRAVVAPAPVGPARYQAFVLDPAPLPYDPSVMAPMGCLPGDFDENGLADLLVYFWGRTPVLYLAHPARKGAPTAASYRPAELVPSPAGTTYRGERWYTNAATQADLDGDGHQDLVIGNYFPDGSQVLNAHARDDVVMQHSMSRALNGGGDHVLRWVGAGRFVDVRGVLPDVATHGWTLAAGAADLDGDLLPEVYFANDFGPDRLVHNESSPGRLRFRLLHGHRGPTTPSSKVLGSDSFKGMGVDFGDLNGDRVPDLLVSNITVPYALEESNFVWLSSGAVAGMRRGLAPYDDGSEPLGLSRSGWAWDARLADLDNDGVLEAMQATGFVKGRVNRWPELQELAMSNDQLLANPAHWPRFRAGDDLSGAGGVRLFARAPGGRYVDVSAEAGFDETAVSRGIALGDADRDGDLDLAVANQWGPPVFYRNDSPRGGASLGLRLLRQPSGSPAIGAEATVRAQDGRVLAAQVDGGSGHSGKRSPELLLGLGSSAPEPVRVELGWRDAHGLVHRQTLWLSPGWHTVELNDHAQEVIR